MEAIFFETTTFTASVSSYLADDEYKALQLALLKNPACGDVMPRTGGFRKLRWPDNRRGKGKRGGLRVIYYWLSDDGQIWMFAIYDKDELTGLTHDSGARPETGHHDGDRGAQGEAIREAEEQMNEKA